MAGFAKWPSLVSPELGGLLAQGVPPATRPEIPLPAADARGQGRAKTSPGTSAGPGGLPGPDTAACAGEDLNAASLVPTQASHPHHHSTEQTLP